MPASSRLLAEFSEFLFDPALADRVRRSPTAFTRNRTLTLPRMAALMMSGMCASVQAELDALFGAKILADNLLTLLSDLDAPHDDRHASRPNRVYALGALKPILGACLLRIQRCLDGLVGVLVVIHQTRCRIQPSRSYPRAPRKAKPHFHLAYKLA